MAYLLDGTEIERPRRVIKEPVEVSATVRTISGSEKKDITAIKYRYILEFRGLSMTEADEITNIYEAKATVTFQSTEISFTVSERDVLVEVSDRDYHYLGSDYLADLTLILTEVDEA